MAKIVVIHLLLLVAMVTVGHGFHQSKINGQTWIKSTDLVIEDGIVGPKVPETNERVTELAMEKKLHAETPIFKELLSKWIVDGQLRGHHRSHRQKRAGMSRARLSQLLQTKSGKKMVKRLKKKKNLPFMLALMKKKKRLREQKLKEAAEADELTTQKEEQNEAEIDKTTTLAQEKDDPTNEINLTVQVEMHKPNEEGEVNPLSSSRNTEDNSIPTMQGLHNSNPFAFPRVQVPQQNVLGISPQWNNRYSGSIVPDIYRDQVSDMQPTYPGVAGMLSGQGVMKNRPYLGSSTSDPELLSIPYQKQLINAPRAFNMQTSQHLLPENRILNDDFSTSQKSNVDINSFPTKESQLNKIDMAVPSDRLEKKFDKSNDVKDTANWNKGKEELSSLLTDIKSIVNSLKPDVVGNSDNSTSNETLTENEVIPISKTNTVSKESSDIKDKEILLLREEIKKLKEAKEIENERASSQPQKVESIPVENDERNNELSTKSNNKNATFTGNKKTSSSQITQNLETAELAENPIIVAEDPDLEYEEKLKSLTSNDFFKTLQKLNLISDREKRIIHRILPKQKANKDFRMIFEELMRRRYFRNAVSSLLKSSGMPTTDNTSDHDLIIALLKVEEKFFQKPTNDKKVSKKLDAMNSMSSLNMANDITLGVTSLSENRPNNTNLLQENWNENINSDSKPEMLLNDSKPQSEIKLSDSENQPDITLNANTNQPDTMIGDKDYGPDKIKNGIENEPVNMMPGDESVHNINVDANNVHEEDNLSHIFTDHEHQHNGVLSDHDH